MNTTMTKKRPAKCAGCGKKPVSPDYRPFCSRRCADVDLGRWLNNGYAIEGEPADQADDPPASTD